MPFSSLPPEIHVGIAGQCETSDLGNLCLTSKWVNQICLPVLYRHIDLDVDRHMCDSTMSQDYHLMLATLQRQQQLVDTLLSRPQYGKYIRTFRGTLYTHLFDLRRGKGEEYITEEEVWRATESLTHVQSVTLGSRNRFSNCMTRPRAHVPSSLFQSATSVTLVGEIQYELAKSILCGLKPAILMHLGLDMVQDRTIELFQSKQQPGDTGEDGRIITHGALSGLLTLLTGRCTALRTLILRRVGQIEQGYEWHAAAEAASYTESAAFIHSVRATLQSLTFEQVEEWLRDARYTAGSYPDRVMDASFQRLVLPAIVSGTWPRLTKLRLHGVRGSDEQGGTDGLMAQLRAVLGGSTTIEVKEKAELYSDEI